MKKTIQTHHLANGGIKQTTKITNSLGHVTKTDKWIKKPTKK